MAVVVQPSRAIRKRPGLVEYLEKRLGSAAGSSGELTFFCPFCIDKLGDESNTRKFYINTNTGKCYCFRCESGFGGIRSFFKALNNGRVLFVEEIIIRGEFKPPEKGVSIRDSIAAAFEAQKPKLLDTSLLKPHKLPEEYEELRPATSGGMAIAWKYWTEKRNMTPKQARRFKVGYCRNGRYGHRLVFPVIQDGEQVYFTTRYCGTGSAMKSLNPMDPAEGGYHRRDTIILNYDRMKGHPIVALCEGPISSFAFDSIPAGALLGKIASPVQVKLVENLVAQGLQELVLSFDADAGKATDKLYAQFGNNRPTGVICYSFRDSVQSAVSTADTYDLLMPTTPATLLEVSGTWGTITNAPAILTAVTGELYPVGGIPYTHLAS